MTIFLYRTCIFLLISINTVLCGPSTSTANKYVRIPAEFSNSLELLRPADRTRFITHCLHLMYMCSKQEVKHYVWGLHNSNSFEFNNFWNWYRCTKTGNPDECPVNGGWSIWSKWGYCDVTCGPGGLQSRFRTCDAPRPLNGGRKCDGQTTQVTKCDKNIACQQNGDSTMLSMVHENYLKKLHRSNPQLKNKCLQSHCSYQEVQGIILQKEEADKYWSYINCYKHSEGCPVDGAWSDWGGWSRCSSNCGSGHRYHLRNCDSPRPLNGGDMCSGSSLEKAKCFEDNCTETVGLHFSPWSHWSQCSASCDEGVRQSIRRCVGVGTCVLSDGTSRETIIKDLPCGMPGCLRKGGWNEWSEWSMCTAICGWGERVHMRSCTNPTPFGPDSTCEGNSLEVEKCSHMEASCLTNGTQPFKQREYSSWSRWTSCRVSCAGGTRLRHRACVDDSTTTTPCIGPLYDVVACNENIPCPVDGVWSEWSQWSTCSETCDSGFTERHRLCINPRPAFGGAVCSGNSTERVDCQDGACLDTSSWSEWGNWTQCSVSCGDGTNSRQRSCLVQDEVVERDRCGGEYRQLSACGIDACPVDGNWANWNGWQPCSVACGEGITSRDRTCTNPTPIGSGNLCVGYGTESRHCFTQPCTMEHGGVMRVFGGSSFIMYEQSGQPTNQVLIYIRLLPKSSDGLILIKRHDTHDHPLVYVSLMRGCVYLYAKVESAELKVVGHPVELFKWNTIQVAITGNLGHVRVNDQYTESGNFTGQLLDNLDYDLPLYLGGCLPHLYPNDESKTTVWSGFVGKIAAFRLNYRLMSLIEDDVNWQGRNRPYSSMNSARDVMDIMATAVQFNGEQFSSIRLNIGEELRDIQTVASAEDSIGLLLYVHGSVSGSFMSLELANNKLVLSVNLGNRAMQLERDLDEIKAWMIVDIKIDPNQISLSVNKGPLSQLSGPDLKFSPSGVLYVGGLPPWESLHSKSDQDNVSGFSGSIYRMKLNGVEYFMENIFKQSWDESVDSASATLADNFQEHYVIHSASVQLRCIYKMYENDVEVVWLRENKVVDTTADYIRLEEDHPLLPNTTILHLHHIDEERQGMYGCQFRFSDRAEIHQAFAVSISEPHDILARIFTEWKMSVIVFFAAVLIAIVITSIVTCFTFICRRPYYILKVVHTTLHSLGFGSQNRTTLADLREVDATYDGLVNFKEEKIRLDQELKLSRGRRIKEAAKEKIEEKKQVMANRLKEKKDVMKQRVKKFTGKKYAGTRRVSQSGLTYTTLRYSDNDDIEGYTRHTTSMQYVLSQESVQSQTGDPSSASVELMENGNNSGTSSKHNKETSKLSFTSLGAVTDKSFSDTPASKELHQLQPSSHHSASPSEEISVNRSNQSMHSPLLSGDILPGRETDGDVQHNLHTDTSDMADSIIREVATSRRDSAHFDDINKQPVVINTSLVNYNVRRQSDFQDRALYLAELLSASGVTPPMKESQVTTPRVTSSVDQLDDADTEEEYEDTHE